MCGLVFDPVPWLTLLLALGALAACVITTLVHVSTHTVLARRRVAPGPRPGISVLKPLKGVDDDLEDNLCSLVRQDYEGPFEIILGAADPDDPALEVVRRLQRRFPRCDIRIVAGHDEPGCNPKVANLAALSLHARYDSWLVSDSNVAVGPGYLASLADELADPGVGMVSNLVAGVGDGDLGAVLENLHLNSFVIGAVCGAEVLAKHPVVIGKSMIVRRAAMARVGGWASVADVLGEDYVLGAAVARAGYRVVLSPYVVRTVNRTWTVDRFVSRHLRWSQMRRSLAPPIYALEPLLNPVPWLLALGLVALVALPAPGLVLLAVTAALFSKILLDGVLLQRLRGSPPAPLELAMIPVKDLWVLGIWALAWFRDTVVWRGHRFRIGRGTRLVSDSRRTGVLTPPPPPTAGSWSTRPSAGRFEP